MVRELLARHISTPPDVIQFAQDRKYEESWIIPINSVYPSDDEIQKYTTHPHSLLIVEYIWNSADDSNRFVLTFFMDNKCKLQDPLQFMHINLALFYSKPNFQTLISTLDEKVVGHPYLLTSKPENVNMSVFNHWLSVGPVELWKSGELVDDASITTKIHSRPDIEKTTLNYQGLLFRYNVSGVENGPSYGIKTPCCKKVGEEWLVDIPLVLDWTHKILV